MTELELLAHEVGVNERTLRRAVTQGTLRGTRPTSGKLALPLSERQFVRRSWGLLSALRTALRTEQNVRFALLFGSTARGTDTPDSDIDLLVDLRDGALERLVDLSGRLTTVVGRPVEAVRLQDAGDEPSLLSDVLAEGRVLVDREELWPGLQRREPNRSRRAHQNESRRAAAALSGIDRLLADRG